MNPTKAERLNAAREKFGLRKITSLNPNGLPAEHRFLDISVRLLVLEQLFEAATSRGSGAGPDPNADDREAWDDWFHGVRSIISDVRRIAEDCYEQVEAE